MGMDLIARGSPRTLSLNISTWDFIRSAVGESGHDPSFLTSGNNGQLIAPDECTIVADALRASARINPPFNRYDQAALAGYGFLA